MIKLVKSPNMYKNYEKRITDILRLAGKLRADDNLPNICDTTLNEVLSLTFLMSNSIIEGRITDDYQINNYLSVLYGMCESIRANYKLATASHHPEETRAISNASVEVESLFNRFYNKYYGDTNIDSLRKMLARVMNLADMADLPVQQLDILYPYMEMVFPSSAMGQAVATSVMRNILMYLSMSNLIIYIKKNEMEYDPDTSLVFHAAHEFSQEYFSEIYRGLFQEINRRIDLSLSILAKENNEKASKLNSQIGNNGIVEITVDSQQINNLLNIASVMSKLEKLKETISRLTNNIGNSQVLLDIGALQLLLSIINNTSLMVMEIQHDNQLVSRDEIVTELIEDIDKFINKCTKQKTV